MYHPDVTRAALEAIVPTLGFDPEYHSVDYRRAAVAHLDTLLDEDGKPKRKLAPDEKRFVLNERAVCQADFLYWGEAYAHVKDEKAGLVLFKPRLPQQIAMQVWGDLELQGFEIAIQNLKARQLGISTITELAVAHRTQFYPHVTSLVASSDPGKSEDMAKMMERCWDEQPWWLMPPVTKRVTGEKIEFGEQDSMLTIQHGTQFTGLARGSTLTVAHLSEVADYENALDLIDASMLRAMHPSPYIFLVLESTAIGRYNYWHNTWLDSKARKNRFTACFLPWFVGVDLYPTDTWLLQHPIPPNWIPAEFTIRHAERARAYVRSNEILSKYLGSDWEMPRKQMYFWEITREEYKSKGALSRFYAELCSDDIECFQSTSASAFDADVISQHREAATGTPSVYSITGPGVPEKMMPDKRDVNLKLPPIPLGHGYELVPLIFNGYSETNPMNKLFIWKWPEDNEEYAFGVDTADGVGQDRSVIEVVRKWDENSPCIQAAEYANDWANANDIVPLCFVVGNLFSTRIAGQRRQARAVIECNGNGEATQHEIRKMGWTNLHLWTRLDYRKLSLKNATRVGWWTTGWSRSMMMDYLTSSLRDGSIEIESPWFVDEMGDLEKSDEQQYIKAMFGGHDDRIMAFGIAFYSLHVMFRQGPMRHIRYSPTGIIGVEKTTKYPTYSPGPQGRDYRPNISFEFPQGYPGYLSPGELDLPSDEGVELYDSLPTM